MPKIKASRNPKKQQQRYYDALICTTYNLCCHSHKDMMHAELCPIMTAERDCIAREVQAIENGTLSLEQSRERSKLMANDRWFAVGIPCWMRDSSETLKSGLSFPLIAARVKDGKCSCTPQIIHNDEEMSDYVLLAATLREGVIQMPVPERQFETQ